MEHDPEHRVRLSKRAQKRTRRGGLQAREVPPKAIADRGRRRDLGPQPMATEPLCGFVRRAASAEGVEHDVPRVGGHLDAPARDQGLQLVDVPAGLELLVPGGGRVFPEIGQVQPSRVEELAMAAVVLDVLSAMPTRRDRQADAIERLRLAFGEVEDREWAG